LKSAITRAPWCKEIYVEGIEGVVLGGYSGDGDTEGGRDTERGKERKGREKAVEKWDSQERGRDEGIERELKEIWKVMGEKGVRVHVDLEDVWDEDEEGYKE
jgi:hypothetical protein